MPPYCCGCCERRPAANTTRRLIHAIIACLVIAARPSLAITCRSRIRKTEDGQETCKTISGRGTCGIAAENCYADDGWGECESSMEAVCDSGVTSCVSFGFKLTVSSTGGFIIYSTQACATALGEVGAFTGHTAMGPMAGLNEDCSYPETSFYTSNALDLGYDYSVSDWTCSTCTEDKCNRAVNIGRLRCFEGFDTWANGGQTLRLIEQKNSFTQPETRLGEELKSSIQASEDPLGVTNRVVECREGQDACGTWSFNLDMHGRKGITTGYGCVTQSLNECNEWHSEVIFGEDVTFVCSECLTMACNDPNVNGAPARRRAAACGAALAAAVAAALSSWAW